MSLAEDLCSIYAELLWLPSRYSSALWCTEDHEGALSTTLSFPPYSSSDPNRTAAVAELGYKGVSLYVKMEILPLSGHMSLSLAA